jgi:hypothetical protein
MNNDFILYLLERPVSINSSENKQTEHKKTVITGSALALALLYQLSG